VLRLVRPAPQRHKRIELGAHRLAPLLRVRTGQSFLLGSGVVAAVDVSDRLDEIVEVLVRQMSQLSCVLHREGVVLSDVRLQAQKTATQIVLKMCHRVLATSAELGGVLHACTLRICHAIDHVASSDYVSVARTMRIDEDLVERRRRNRLELVRIGRAVARSKPILLNQIE